MDDIWGRFWKAVGPSSDTHAPAQVGGACRAPGTKIPGFVASRQGFSPGLALHWPSLGSQAGLAPGGRRGLTTVCLALKVPQKGNCSYYYYRQHPWTFRSFPQLTWSP